MEAGRWRGDRVLWAMLAVGIVLRLIVDGLTGGLPFDIQSFTLLRTVLDQHPLHVYSLVNHPGVYHWPYPSGFFPFVWLSGGLADLLGGGFGHLVRLPAIGADAALAWLVWIGLAGRMGERDRLVAAGLVVFGPVFVTISGYAGQIDAVAILPAVIALWVWEREAGPDRAWLAGALIGLGGALKTVPLLMVLALAPSARSWRELVKLVVAAGAVVLVAMAPFLIADHHGARQVIHYSGVPGLGGLSLLLQPNLGERWLTRYVAPSPLTSWLFIHHSGLDNGLVVAAFAGYAAICRPQPRRAAVVLWLLILAFGSGFFFQYLIWGLPFFLLAGHVKATALLQVVVGVPMVIFYLGPWHHELVVYVFVALMLTAWVGWVSAVALLIRRDLALRDRGLTLEQIPA